MHPIKNNTQERIMAAAAEVFAESGYLGATTQKIAAAAKVNEVTLFRHFGSKERLFKAVLSQFASRQGKILKAAAEANENLEDILTDFATSYLKCLGKYPDFMRTVVGEMRRHPHEVKEVVHEIVAPICHIFLSLLKRRQKDGEIHSKVDCEIAVDIFRGMLFSRIVMLPVAKRHYSDKEYAIACVDMFMRSIRP